MPQQTKQSQGDLQTRIQELRTKINSASGGEDTTAMQQELVELKKQAGMLPQDYKFEGGQQPGGQSGQQQQR